MLEHSPNPDLFMRSEAATLGHCDAFISHSWHDDPDSKWAALQSWRSAFIEKNHREPLVWLDKCCIDQRSIELDLRSLPVFVSGCKKLVILCGTTYVSRLWCIMEVFTYVHMGGALDSIEVVPVLREGNEQDDLDILNTAFEEFEAEQCTCDNELDKAKMLMIIHAAFGSIDGFNVAVHAILAKIGLREEESTSSSHEANETRQMNNDFESF